jgi:hypothetical protein
MTIGNAGWHATDSYRISELRTLVVRMSCVEHRLCCGSHDHSTLYSCNVEFAQSTKRRICAGCVQDVYNNKMKQ